VYLENYTSRLGCDVADLEKFYTKKIILAEREFVESEQVVDMAQDKDVALLIIGDVFSATTHIQLVMACQRKNVVYTVVHNAGVFNAIGITGLELYKFGKITSIPFDHEHVTTPIDVFHNNQKIGLHTLFLLDLDPKENRFLSVNEAILYLLKHNINKNTMAIVCLALGNTPVIKCGSLEELEKIKYDRYPQSLIIPGKLHFMEEEMLAHYGQ